MSTFASELGVTFPIQLEANHVVHESQVHTYVNMRRWPLVQVIYIEHMIFLYP